MIKFHELIDRSSQTFNFYEFQDYRLFLIDINTLSLRAYGFVVHGDNVDYFFADIWQKDSVEYLYWTDRYNDKIIEFRANMRISHTL